MDKLSKSAKDIGGGKYEIDVNTLKDILSGFFGVAIYIDYAKARRARIDCMAGDVLTLGFSLIDNVPNTAYIKKEMQSIVPKR